MYVQRTTKGGKAIERFKKKLLEQESLLLLMSPSMAFRVANRNGKVSQPLTDYSLSAPMVLQGHI